jgi:hypothetical protein
MLSVNRSSVFHLPSKAQKSSGIALGHFNGERQTLQAVRNGNGPLKNSRFPAALFADHFIPHAQNDRWGDARLTKSELRAKS